MPRKENTRKQRAAELLSRLENGPSFCMTFFNIGLSCEQRESLALNDDQLRAVELEFKKAYQNWSSSCVLSEFKSLVPELRES